MSICFLDNDHILTIETVARWFFERFGKQPEKIHLSIEFNWCYGYVGYIVPHEPAAQGMNTWSTMGRVFNEMKAIQDGNPPPPDLPYLIFLPFVKRS